MQQNTLPKIGKEELLKSNLNISNELKRHEQEIFKNKSQKIDEDEDKNKEQVLEKKEVIKPLEVKEKKEAEPKKEIEEEEKKDDKDKPASPIPTKEVDKAPHLTKNLSKEDILVQLNYISKEEMEEARELAPEGRVIEYLLQEKKITKDILGQALAEANNLTYFDLNTAGVPKENFFAISMTTAKTLRILIVKIDEKSIDVTTDTPENIDLIMESLSKTFKDTKINLLYSLAEDLDEAFNIYREGLQQRLDEVLESDNPNFAAAYFDELIKDALEQRASDIHMEPGPESVLIRFRVDGMLQEVATISHDYYENILNRIKVLANIRLDEHYRTQDGAIRYQVNDVSIDFRVSIIPIMEGQKVAIRLLADYIKNMALEELGLSKTNYELIDKASKKTYGMILTTGPTGSGKTTTLYSLLKILNRAEVNVTTIEDPVEYRIMGVNQIQVDVENEITFAKGLRSIVRQDPNIILVGEIRDRETVEIAINAALTGHLLLSTFHANNAATAIPRLLDMGVEPFLLASTLNLIIAQRLVRRICASCKFSKEYDLEMLKKLMPTTYKKYFPKAPLRLYQGKGCDKCNFTGNKGRIGIFELIYITEQIQDLILHQAPSKEIWAMAESQGAINFFTDGLEKVMMGEVSLEELIRVAPVETQEENVYGKNQKTA